MPPLLRIPLLAGLLLLASGEGNAWQRVDGSRIEGEPVRFDYAAKTLRFESPVSRSAEEIPARDLSLRGRQRLLLSPLFLRSYPEDLGWSAERQRLYLYSFLAPAIALLAGFWIAALVLARKAHPFRAVIAWMGSWMIGALFVSFYIYFSQRIGGGLGTVLVGGGLGLVFLAFFISAVYDCSIFKGLLIFLLQLFAGSFFAIVAFALSDTLFEEQRVESFWNEKVFVPVGMVDSE